MSLVDIFRSAVKKKKNSFSDLEFTKVNQSPPPFRWIVNAIGAWGAYHVLRSAFAEKRGRKRIASFHYFIFRITLPIDLKWGTYYKMVDKE
jgi:hypothetical protein